MIPIEDDTDIILIETTEEDIGTTEDAKELDLWIEKEYTHLKNK